MNYRILFISLLLFSISGSHFAASAQKSAGAPKQERLLNGLKVYFWHTPGAERSIVKVRVHTGSAFDPQGREGAMDMLARSIFPNDAARDYFVAELDGSLDIRTSYDSVQITAAGRSKEFIAMLETLASAITNPSVDKETVAVLKLQTLEQLNKTGSDPVFIADAAAASRLFGTFPYGRPVIGTPESVSAMDEFDLARMRERFFTADNASIAISSSTDPATVVRAIKRFFGAWAKADKKVPATFRQPDPPEQAVDILRAAKAEATEIRFAARGTARNDRDFTAAEVLARILDARMKTAVGDASVEHVEHLLPGSFIFRARMTSGLTSAEKEKLHAKAAALIAVPVTQAEFAAARAEIAAARERTDRMEMWLDADTYRFSLDEDARIAAAVTLADVQRVAERLARGPFAAVAVMPEEKPAAQ